MKYSILIPVYNVEKYLRKCLDSILEQKIGNYEVILVNDGSTDSSKSICEEYVNKDNRFKLINQKNRGLLIARRTALKVASGEYILFLDSDDFWEPNLLSEVDARINHDKPDVLVFCFNRYSGITGEKVPEIIFSDNVKFTADNKIEYVRAWINNPDLNAIWTKVVNRKCIDYWDGYNQFEGLSSGEDYVQSIYIIEHSSKILYCGRALYNYRNNENSISHVFNQKKILEFFKARTFFWEYIERCYSNETDIAYDYWKAFFTWLIRDVEQLYESSTLRDIKRWNEFIINQWLYKKGSPYYNTIKSAMCLYEKFIYFSLRLNCSFLCFGLGRFLKLVKKYIK